MVVTSFTVILMTQEFKSIYFSDFPADFTKQRNLTLAFGRQDAELYKAIKPLSSHELRELLGHPNFSSLQRAAVRKRLGVNPYCLGLLREQLSSRSNTEQADLPWTKKPSSPLIEPIQATFRGGQKEPLHDWYPYLEGYSPRFVEQIIDEFVPDASVILDPFGGTGTTALTATRLGRNGIYCELNPLLQYLIEAKVIATSLDGSERRRIGQVLKQITMSFGAMLKAAVPDLELQIAYSRTFAHSQFFDAPIFEDVLRARTVIDKLACSEPIAAKFLTVAVLSSLVEVSRLIRRGDLRFRNKKELKLTSNLAMALKDRLNKIASDLEQLTQTVLHPLLICENARSLENLPALQVEAVITSPPYPNGTNYFRNTKLELWFLRCLRTSNDLSDFRFKAVTAGINDVTSSKPGRDTTNEVSDIVSQLEASAYDNRIPRMIACYFDDIKAIFSATRKHLVSGARVIIDIGDSAYGGVRVPSHSLLTSVLKSEGYVFDREILLRKRISRGRLPLKQVLLIFQYRPARAKTNPVKVDYIWRAAWTQFKKRLPHQKGDFAKRNWGHPLHSLCSYQGKMKPSLASHLVSTFVPRGGSILDPFAGVGTIPFEAALQGIKAYAFEISPAALRIATAKLSPPSALECTFVMDSLQQSIVEQRVRKSEISSANAIHFNRPLLDYFNEKTLGEILLARRHFKTNPPQSPSESLVFAALLHILHGNRPYALSRRSHPITPFAPTGDNEYRPLMPRLREKVRRSLEVKYTDEFVSGQTFYQDATSWWPQSVDNLDAIITSPPFFDSTRFYLANWMRLWFCGWEAADFKTEPLAFVDERQKRSFGIYEPIFRQARERLKRTGVLVLHLGKSKKCDMAEALARVASPWFEIADVFTESVDHCESHGIRDKGTVTDHQFLILQ